MREPLAPLQQGKAPSLLDTQTANEVVDACAAFVGMTVLPQGAGTLAINGRKATLTINAQAAGGGGNGESMTFTVCIGGVATDVIVTSAVLA